MSVDESRAQLDQFDPVEIDGWTDFDDVDDLDALDEHQVEDDHHVGEWTSLDYTDPIDHGFGLEAVVNDLDRDSDTESSYRRFWRGWRSNVEDPSHEPFIVLEDVHRRWDWLHDDFPAHLVLQSKPWKVGTSAATDGGTNGTRYEYSLQVMRYEPDDDDDDVAADPHDRLRPKRRLPTSFQCWIQPQNEDLVYKDGGHLKCQYGEGTKYRVQTTYAGSAEAQQRLVQVVTAGLEALGHDRPDWSQINDGSRVIWKGEVHHRFIKKMMQAVVQKLRSAKLLVEYGGGGDVSGGSDFVDGAHVEEKVVSDMWDRIGFAGPFAREDGYNLGLKVYRVSGSPADERLENPKLEAFFGGTSGDQTLPHVSEWQSLRRTLRQMCNAMAIRSGVALGDLRADDYYDPDERPRPDTLVPKGWRRAQQAANEERERRILKTTYESISKARWDVLWSVAAYEGATYDQLVEITGYSRDYIREIIRGLEQRNVLRRTTYPRVIVYHNEELRLNAREALQEVYPDRDLQDIRTDADERRERRQERRQECDDQADAAEDAAGDGAAQADEDDDLPPAVRWLCVDELAYSAADIGRYLEQGDIDPEHVKIRTDPYGWVG